MKLYIPEKSILTDNFDFVLTKLTKSPRLAKYIFSFMLFNLKLLLSGTSLLSSSFNARLKEKNCTAQIKTKDNKTGRFFTFKDGSVISKSGIHKNPDITITYSKSSLAVRLMTPWRDQLEQISAMKNFQIWMEGPDELTSWFMEILSLLLSIGTKYGIDQENGVKRYVSGSNGGPIFVYVKDGKIIRITPIDLDETDAESWTIEARGRSFTPPRKATLSPYSLSLKSMIYSRERLLYPMKRVDFNADGDRNCENRGISGYERISWDEALNIVAGEITRVKTDYGPGAIMSGSGSHHMWGILGYWLSAKRRFMNTLGCTPVLSNPDSWEGWYWGAMHHWGNSMRLGASEAYGTLEDIIKECEMVVFWSSDPESTSGVYGAFEGTIRRQWLKELGVKFVHIDPYYNHTAALFGGKWLAPRPATGNALALAIAYVWIKEDLYDKEYVADRTTGFEIWKDYIPAKVMDLIWKSVMQITDKNYKDISYGQVMEPPVHGSIKTSGEQCVWLRFLTN